MSQEAFFENALEWGFVYVEEFDLTLRNVNWSFLPGSGVFFECGVDVVGLRAVP